MKARLLLAAGIAALSFAGPTVAAAESIHFFAVLRGENEIPAADPDGYGTAMISFRGAGLRTICVSLFVDAIDKPNMAHIHRGGGGTSGGIEVTLTKPDKGTTGTSLSCVEISSALSKEIRAKPYDFYVNVHTGKFGGGAVRGQLF